MTAKQKLQAILNGEFDFYFEFNRIGIYKNGQLVTNFTEENCPGSTSVFKRGGIAGGIVAKIDFKDDETWAMIQNLGVFRGLYPGFDLYLDPNGWFLNSDTSNQYSIGHPIGGGEIDFLILISEGEKVRLQIVAGQTIVLLTDVVRFH